MKTGSFLARLRPRTVAGQLALLVIASIAATHLVATLALFMLREPWRAEARPGVAANRVAVIALLLDETAPEQRAAILGAAGRSVPSLRLAAWDGAGPRADNAWVRDHPVVARMREAFARPLTITDLSDEPGREDGQTHLRIGLATPNGALLSASLPDDAIGPPKQGIIVLTLVFFATTVTLLSLWATRALTAPLGQLAGAAEAFGTRTEAPPLPDRGPAEVLALAAALDRMRARVARLLADRTQMLAAVSHDLRTPITRMRLRAEFIDDAQLRERTLRDLDQMNALAEAALAFARDERRSEAPSDRARPLIDLAALVQTVCDGFDDIGADVSVEQPPHLLVRADPDDLERALTNLIDNAIKYGKRARLCVKRNAKRVVIEIEDDGPGIPKGERAAMLQPFVRGDRARGSSEAEGFGLGLSIVCAIVKGHGGRLDLDEASSGGLRVRFDLPAATEGVPPQAGESKHDDIPTERRVREPSRA